MNKEQKQELFNSILIQKTSDLWKETGRGAKFDAMAQNSAQMDLFNMYNARNVGVIISNSEIVSLLDAAFEYAQQMYEIGFNEGKNSVARNLGFGERTDIIKRLKGLNINQSLSLLSDYVITEKKQ